ncbi:MAG: hypothetical protein ACEQSA_02485 [Weeksellaceae bacterium]
MTTQQIIAVNKPISLTPLDAIELFKTKYPEYKTSKIGYAGRLDPMASGMLLLLIEDANLRRKEFEMLEKVYEFEVLFGIETDTYDVMGMIQSEAISPLLTEQSVVTTLNGFKGTFTQPYPPFSSARVDGKPLYYWARAGKLAEHTIPTKEVTVHDISMIDARDISIEEVLENVIQRISKTKGEFRQAEIIETWKKQIEVMKSKQIQTLPLYRFTASVSSGTYIRSIAHTLGKLLETPAIAYSIQRTTVGDFTLGESYELS